MNKIWNALRYGDKDTRLCIGGVILFSFVAVVLIVISGIVGKFGLFIVGMLFAVVAIILSQTFTLVDDSFVAEIDSNGRKDTINSYSVMKVGATSASRISSSKTQSNSRETARESTSGDLKKETENTDAGNGISAQFDHYNQQLLKKIQKKYHVKKDHRPIIIDSSMSYHIKECPAFIWRSHNKVFLLLLEKEPRRIAISRELIHHMGYAPNIRADRAKEYQAFKKENLITSVFEGYLPDYFDSKAKNPNLKLKNLYEIYPDIRISNRSAATVMDLLYLNFMPEDKITQSEKLNGFFKRVYAAHIMYQDKVYSITEYKENIEKILKEMCYAEIPMREFEVTLDNLVKGRMISLEYANHYMDTKKKIKLKSIPSK